MVTRLKFSTSSKILTLLVVSSSHCFRPPRLISTELPAAYRHVFTAMPTQKSEKHTNLIKNEGSIRMDRLAGLELAIRRQKILWALVKLEEPQEKALKEVPQHFPAKPVLHILIKRWREQTENKGCRLQVSF